MIEPHLFIFAFQNYIYISQHRATCGKLVGVVKICHRHSPTVTRFLAKDMMAVNTVSKEGFVGLINKLDRRYQLQSRNYFSHFVIPQMYDTCVKKVSSELRQLDFYASTTDLWSSRTTEPYELHRSLSYSRL